MSGHHSKTPFTPKLSSASQLPGPVLGADGERDVPTLEESRWTVFIGCRDNGLWQWTHSGLLREPPRGIYGKVVAWWVQGTESIPRGVWRGKASERESQGQSTVGPIGFRFAFDGESLKYFEQMSDTIYVDRLFWLLGRAAPVEQEWMWLEGNGSEAGMVMPAAVNSGQIGMCLEGRAGRTCSWI